MRIKWYWIVLTVIVLGVIVDKYLQNKQEKKFLETIESLEKERDSIEKQRIIIYGKVDSLDNIIRLKNNKVDSLNKKADSLSKIRYEIPNNVRNYDDAKLDSILTNYRHPKRN